MKTAARKIVETYVGADGRILYFLAKQADGTAFDLTGYTVTITAKNGSTTKIDDEECTVTNDAEGAFTYTPEAEEIDEAGDYDAQVKLVDGSSLVNYLEQFIIQVNATL